MTDVWVVRYWMPPEKFLTFTGCYATEAAAERGAWDDVLAPMHTAGWLPVVHPASDYFPRDERADGKVVAPTHGERGMPSALALVTKETVHE